MSVARTDSSDSESGWRTQLRHAIRDPRALINRLGLSGGLLKGARAAHDQFPTLVPRSYLQRIEPANPDDPLLRQILPVEQETAPQPDGFSDDPLAEQPHRDGPAILHKYANRALLVTTGACAIHCRYCFRRSYPYSQQGSWRAALRYWQEHGAPVEVILSGGDPLMLDDAALSELIQGLEGLAGVRRIRIHSRMPVVIPQRITGALIERLATSSLQTVWVIHANHPQEIDAEVLTALTKMARGGSMLLNQTVLLRAINDDPDTLARLSEQLFAGGVLPYYIHQLDPISGAAHFAVDDTQAQAIVTDLTSRLPGYLVPRLAREEPGAAAKTLLGAG